MQYPLSKQGVFLTVQGEGILSGSPQVFIRLAGCDVNCPDCDTDYSVHERVAASEIVRRAINCAPRNVRWVWLTGGEPTIHDLVPLVSSLRENGYRIALATSGTRPVHFGSVVTFAPGGFDFISVSPHRIDSSWVQRRGSQLNIVPGLNGVTLSALQEIDTGAFDYKYVTPMWYSPADKMDRVNECVEWVRAHPDWRLGIQAHKFWGIS
jgi:7-carboxy-7-deazaguanine synthase